MKQRKQSGRLAVIGDRVRVIGSNQYRGMTGTVVEIYMSRDRDPKRGSEGAMMARVRTPARTTLRVPPQSLEVIEQDY